MHSALQADHDDDPGGVVRRDPAGGQHWNRLRTAPAARRCRGWRSPPVPISHPLHHTGHLSRARSAAPHAIFDCSGCTTTGAARESGTAMNPSIACIRRPVATTLLALSILLLGGLALLRLPIAALPAVERPTIAVYAGIPGASADTVASSMTQALERSLGTIPGIVEMTSFSATGGAQIVIQFDLEKDINAAANEVQMAINAAGPYLPKDMPSPPYYRKVNPSGFAPVALALTSDLLRPSEVYDLADSVVVQKLSELPGVADVRVSGAERSAVRIQLYPGRIASMNLALEHVREAVRAATLNLPKGSITFDGRSYFVAANDQLTKADEYRGLIVRHRNGAAVQLNDIAKIEDSVINARLAGWFNDKRAVLVYVFKQPDANVVEIVDLVKAVLPQMESWLPSSVKIELLYDRTTLIRASIVELALTVQIAIALVLLVVGLFVRRLWATLIPSLAIPVTLAGTMIVIYLAGYGLDNLTLMAIAIAVGFIVDDAVIVVEYIARLCDEGSTAIAAAVEGVRQISFTVLSITVALLAALLPVLLMPDVVGR